MNPKIVIRDETNADVGMIAEVTIAAFKTLEISNHIEQFIIEALLAAKSLTVSLVAEVDGCVVGILRSLPLSSRTAPGTGTDLDLFLCCRSTSGRALAKL